MRCTRASIGALLALVGYRIANPPGPAGLLETRPGIWIGLVCAGLIGVGGLMLRAEPVARPALAPPSRPPADLSW